MIDPNYSASIAINWYFLIVSCIILTIAGTILTEKVMVHRFPVTKEELAQYDFDEDAANLSPVQKKGLKVAGIAFLVYLAVVLLLSLPIFGETAILAEMCIRDSYRGVCD